MSATKYAGFDEPNYYEYEIKAVAYDFLASKIDLNIMFCFDNIDVVPYIEINFSDEWSNTIKMHDETKISPFEDRVSKLYEKSSEKQFKEILKRSMDYFEIGQDEIREFKIKKIIDYEK